jgi:hypothetical protein
MTIGIELGRTNTGAAGMMDLEELLATRLLVQGNSGSGKSHLLRRLMEQSAPWVQQAVIDPEGDFTSLADRFGHLVIDAAAHPEEAMTAAGDRVRRHRVSVVLNLEGLEMDRQLRHAAAFLGGLFDAERDHWTPMLVVVDEAQLFAPSAGGDTSDEARRAALSAMTDLMCRGRKRGLAGIIATQRLAKLAKNVAAEASNFLMGRTFLDIDMARAAARPSSSATCSAAISSAWAPRCRAARWPCGSAWWRRRAAVPAHPSRRCRRRGRRRRGS